MRQHSWGLAGGAVFDPGHPPSGPRTTLGWLGSSPEGDAPRNAVKARAHHDKPPGFLAALSRIPACRDSMADEVERGSLLLHRMLVGKHRPQRHDPEVMCER